MAQLNLNLGRKYCTNLISKLGVNVNFDHKQYFPAGFDNYHEICKEFQILHCGNWSGYTPFIECGYTPKDSNNHPLLSQMRESENVLSKVEEPETCMICLDAVPNTIIFPCAHNIVCRSCSDELIGTNNEKLCIKCRQPITEICLINP